MPKYDYRCDNCGHEFEKNLKISERKNPEQEPCPSCEFTDVGQVIGKVAYIGEKPGKTTDNFNDRLKELKKRAGKDNTINTR